MARTNLAVSHGIVENTRRVLNILILDDDAVDRQRLRRQASEFDFQTIVDEADGLFLLEEKLDERSYDVVLLDYNLMAGDGIDALNIIANHPVNQNAALVMVAGAPRYDFAVEAMKHGCDEFVGKSGLNTKQLQKTILEAVLASTRKASVALGVELEGVSNALANGISEMCLIAMKPKLSRIQRHIMVLENHISFDEKDRHAVETIGQSCNILQDFLSAAERKAPSIDEPVERIVPLK